ncbi:MAG TPA: NADP-dependent oxidoreductase [Acidimicrobiales bacterium]|nr:NADP-dependent oxidoreductase [Acidimicrobiales bacterium]
MSTIRVVELVGYGGPEMLRVAERELPEPLPTEVRVRVRAAGVNPVDWKTRAGRGMARVLGEPPVVLGWDVAGVVEAVGDGVTRFEVGDEVFGMPWFPRQAGAYGEAVTAPSRQFALKPVETDFVAAAALPLAGLTAWQVLVDTADVQPGQRVLIVGASGGVGHLAVQIAKSRGAVVIGTARAEHHDVLAELGIDELVDYTEVAFEDHVEDIDLAVDLVGGEYGLRCLDVLRPGGLLVAPAGLPEGIEKEAAAHQVEVSPFLVEPDGAALDEIAELVEEGALHVAVAGTFPLASAAAAHEAGERGGLGGKLVLVV